MYDARRDNLTREAHPPPSAGKSPALMSKSETGGKKMIREISKSLLNGKFKYNFYPDTFNESGLAIAMRTLYPLMDSGDIETITFVENSETLRRLENER